MRRRYYLLPTNFAFGTWSPLSPKIRDFRGARDFALPIRAELDGAWGRETPYIIYKGGKGRKEGERSKGRGHNEPPRLDRDLWVRDTHPI